MITYHDVLTKTRGDLKEWKRLIKSYSDLKEIYPDHTEELELTIRALEIAIEKEDEK
ncbi:MAG: hypothetical protein LUD72_02590 [Bacteroidales bacterium]|nr:hypothetical protein [Bacteroidales bacterium]